MVSKTAKRTLPVMCAYHSKYFGHELHMDGPVPGPDDVISHGMCRACQEYFLKEEVPRGTVYLRR